jgi:aminoglycoside 3-N-acetyltransferase I
VPSSLFTLRRLRPADIGLLRALNALFGEAFGEPETYTADPPDDTWLQTLLAEEHVVVLVALEGETMLGGLLAYELSKIERARREFYIYDLAVAEEHRRRGVATALIGHLRTIAAERGAWVIYVQADYGDDPAVALYTKLGTREDVMHFDIPVNDRPHLSVPETPPHAQDVSFSLRQPRRRGAGAGRPGGGPDGRFCARRLEHHPLGRRHGGRNGKSCSPLLRDGNAHRGGAGAASGADVDYLRPGHGPSPPPSVVIAGA